MRQMLIVEDEPDLRECLKDFFNAKGFAVVSVSSGEEAVEWLGAHAADVLLVDIVMPGQLSGLDVVKSAKEHHPATQIIMVTGQAGTQVQTLARQYGAIAYITKPFDFSDATWAPVLAHLARPLRVENREFP